MNAIAERLEKLAVGPTDVAWAVFIDACGEGARAIQRLSDRIALLEGLLREAEVYCPRGDEDALGNRIEAALKNEKEPT